MARGKNPALSPLSTRATSAPSEGTSRLDADLVATHVEKRRQEALKQLSSSEHPWLNGEEEKASLRERLVEVRSMLRRISYAHTAGEPEVGLIPEWIERATEALDPGVIPDPYGADAAGFYYYGGHAHSQLIGGQEAEAAWLRQVLPTLIDDDARAEFLEREKIGVSISDDRLRESARATLTQLLRAGEHADARASAIAYYQTIGQMSAVKHFEASTVADWERQARRLAADERLDARLSELQDGEDNPYRFRSRHSLRGHYLLAPPPTQEEFDAMLADPPTGAEAEAVGDARTSLYSRRHATQWPGRNTGFDTYEGTARRLRSAIRKREAAGTLGRRPLEMEVSETAVLEAIAQLGERPGAGGVAVTASVHPRRRGQRVLRVHTRMMVSADDGTEVPVLLHAEIGETTSKTEGGIDKAARRALKNHASLVDRAPVELLSSAGERPTRWSVSDPQAAPVSHIMGPERCRHERGQWLDVSSHDTGSITKGLMLSCGECERAAITYVPLHQVSAQEWGAHTRTTPQEYDALLRWQADMRGTTPVTLSQLQASGAPRPSLRPEDYAISPTRASATGTRTSLRDTLAGRRPSA